tara:strand:+ start:85 stop:303 length:219 start_codon:yes stop_codon:yes gene_type:complete
MKKIKFNKQLTAVISLAIIGVVTFSSLAIIVPNKKNYYMCSEYIKADAKDIELSDEDDKDDNEYLLSVNNGE